MSFRLIKQIFTFAVIVAVAAGSYWVYSSEIQDAEALAESVESGQYQTELDRIQSLLGEVSEMQLGVTLFQEVFYARLSDRSIKLVPDSFVGRVNPFLPIGEEPDTEPEEVVEEETLPDLDGIDLSLIIEPEEDNGEEDLGDDLDSLLEELGGDLLSGDIEL